LGSINPSFHYSNTPVLRRYYARSSSRPACY
jgi:hypothetical protein